MSYRLKRLLRNFRRELGDSRRMRRFRRELRPDDVFVVSYPKSGTHWAGFFLAALVAERSGANAETVTFRRWQEQVPLLDLQTGDSDRILEFRDRPGPRVFMTHSRPLDCLPRVALLVRDPRDIFLSYLHHQRRVDPGFHGDERRFCRDLIQGRVWPGDWAEHTRGWLDRMGEDPFVLRYEELKADARGGFGRLLGFAGIRATDEQIGKALDVSSFDRMKESEKRDGMRGSDGDASVPFMRQGGAKGWRRQLRPELLPAMELCWGEALDRLGYERAAVAPAPEARVNG